MSVRTVLLRATHRVRTSLIDAATLTWFALGLWLVIELQVWFAFVGTDFVAPMVAILAMVGSVLLLTPSTPHFLNHVSVAGWILAALVATSLNPLLVQAAAVPYQFVTDDLLVSGTVRALCLIPAVLCFLVLPFVLLGEVLKQSLLTGGPKFASMLFGFGMGTFVFAQLAGAVWTQWITIALLTLSAIWQFHTQRGRSETIVAQQDSHDGLPLPRLLGACLLLAIWPTSNAILHSWAVISLWSVLGQLGAFGLGLWCGTQLKSRRWSARALALFNPIYCLSVAVMSILMLFVFESTSIAFFMWISAKISMVVPIQLARMGLLGATPLLIGMTLRVATGPCSPVAIRQIGLTGGGSILLCLFLLSQSLPPESILATLGILMSGVVLLQRDDTNRGRDLLRRLVTASALGVLSWTMFATDTSILPARVLYNRIAIAEYLNGTEWDALRYLDDGRVTDRLVTSQATYVKVEYRNLQTTLRRNGIPFGQLSLDYRIMPQSPVDILLTALPLSMHHAPNRVAFLGWGTGTSISTALEFPVVDVVCYEEESGLPEFTFPLETQHPWRGLNPHQDNRVKVQSVGASSAMRAAGPSFDVMISNPLRSEQLDSIDEFHREFYISCLSRLNEEGLFCQRYQHADHGPHALMELLATIRGVFPRVFTINLIPGETLIVASVSADLDRLDPFVSRIQGDHVRRVLTRCGWDWGHLLKLPAISRANVDQLLTTHHVSPTRTVFPEIAWSHPWDAIRWGDKWNEKAVAFQSAKSRLADLMGDEGRSADVVRRMEEVNSQQYVMSEYADTPWAYRTKLKDLLLTKPRSVVVQTRGQKPRNEMHPVDQRRVDYLKALSRAYNTEAGPSEQTIHAMTNFVAPYDPLLSYFTHHEAAELYSRASELNPKAEYQHRLVTIYYGDSRDRSVRNVVRSMELLLAHPEILDEESARFSHLNGLLQVLLQRWQIRRGTAPASVDEGISDVRESLEVAESALTELNQLAIATSYGANAWSHREKYLQRSLVRPLRSYRGQLIPHLEKERRRESKSATNDPATNE